MNVIRSLKGLKGRIARAFVLLALISSGFFSLVSYLSVEQIEAQVIDAHLEKLAEKLIKQYRAGQMTDTPPEISFFINETIPAQLQSLLPGIYEARLDQRDVQALIQVDGVDRFAVVQEMSEFEHTEFIIFLALAVGFCSSLLLAVMLGMATARRIVAPVSALAEAVARNNNPDSLPSLDAEDEIGVLARAFAKRTEELQQFLTRERLFTGDVSHELRTPLTIMLGAAELLKVHLADRPEQCIVAERLRRVALETAERVSALLLLSRSPELLDAPLIALTPLLQSELDRCQSFLKGKPVYCEVDIQKEVWILARPELVSIAVGNLLRNACQYTEEGVVRVRLTDTDLVIEDSGPGLPDSVYARLFERFVQGGGDDSHTGTGLGLSIVKRVVEHLGWDIRLEPLPQKGSRFTLFFPTASSSATALTHS